MIPLLSQNKSKGYIVESGSNDNGNWIKYSDGTMICTKTIDLGTDVNFSTQYGSVYYLKNNSYKTWNFPKEFTELYSINGSLRLPGGIGGIGFSDNFDLTSKAGFYAYSVTNYDFAGKKVCAYLTAIGKWK